MDVPLGGWVHIDGASFRIGASYRDERPGVMIGLEPGGVANLSSWRRFDERAMAELLASPHRMAPR